MSTFRETVIEKGISRRAVLGWAAGGAVGAAAVGLTAAVALANEDSEADTVPVTDHSAMADGAVQAIPPAPVMTDAEMNAMHEGEIGKFLANIKEPITAGVGATDLDWREEDGVRIFELTCSEIDWEVTPGKIEKALAYNGMVPGPTIRAVQGQRVRILVHNDMAESTAVHWHGQRVPNDQDGVTFITQPPIGPGEDYVYEFTAGPFGSHMYHSHHNAAAQVGRGLLGAFLVEPADPTAEPESDLDYLYILNDTLGGFTINGKGFPATSAYTAKLGQRVRFRFMNEGLMVHPIHLHGFAFEIFARDGYPLPQPFLCDTITVAPGERWDAMVIADAPGIWAFHCHVLSHAESPTGMFGMVTVLAVE